MKLLKKEAHRRVYFSRGYVLRAVAYCRENRSVQTVQTYRKQECLANCDNARARAIRGVSPRNDRGPLSPYLRAWDWNSVACGEQTRIGREESGVAAVSRARQLYFVPYANSDNLSGAPSPSSGNATGHCIKTKSEGSLVSFYASDTTSNDRVRIVRDDDDHSEELSICVS